MVMPAVRQDRDGLADALREARLAEAAHFEAALDLRDSKSLRLQLLKDDLLPAVQSSPEAQDLFDLSLCRAIRRTVGRSDLLCGDGAGPPHLPLAAGPAGRAATSCSRAGDRDEAAAAIRRHMAHRLVARERQSATAGAGLGPPDTAPPSLILAWASGFAFGALALVAGAHLSRPFKVLICIKDFLLSPVRNKLKQQLISPELRWPVTKNYRMPPRTASFGRHRKLNLEFAGFRLHAERFEAER